MDEKEEKNFNESINYFMKLNMKSTNRAEKAEKKIKLITDHVDEHLKYLITIINIYENWNRRLLGLLPPLNKENLEFCMKNEEAIDNEWAKIGEIYEDFKKNLVKLDDVEK